MYFLNFQPKDMPNLCLNFNESQSTYGYKRYGYRKRCLIIVIYIGSNFACF